MADKTPEEIEAERIAEAQRKVDEQAKADEQRKAEEQRKADIEAAADKLIAERAAKAAQVAERERAERAVARRKRIEKAGRDATVALIREVSDAVHRSVPYAARQHGAMEIPEGHAFRELERDIPDGAFRVLGRDWILRFADGRLAEIVMARPTTNPDEYIEI